MSGTAPPSMRIRFSLIPGETVTFPAGEYHVRRQLRNPGDIFEADYIAGGSFGVTPAPSRRA